MNTLGTRDDKEKTHEQELNELSDMCHEYNNLQQKIFAEKMRTGYKSTELRKLRFAKAAFCLFTAVGLVMMIVSSCLIAMNETGQESGLFLFIRTPVIFSVFVIGWWMSCRAIAKEKILIGHGIS